MCVCAEPREKRAPGPGSGISNNHLSPGAAPLCQAEDGVSGGVHMGLAVNVPQFSHLYNGRFWV